MSGSAIRETLGFLGVMASMVFVGIEIQQNTTVARAAARQALTENYLDFILTLAADSAARSSYTQTFGVGADPFAGSSADLSMWANIRSMENVFLQVHEGVVDESVLLSYGWNDNPTFQRDPFRAWWSARRHRFHPDFVADFEAEYHLTP